MAGRYEYVVSMQDTDGRWLPGSRFGSLKQANAHRDRIMANRARRAERGRSKPIDSCEVVVARMSTELRNRLRTAGPGGIFLIWPEFEIMQWYHGATPEANVKWSPEDSLK